jgi:GH25 family lysozyme M1 (1,4-beta-N-acetylmuramidase)
VGKKEDIFLLQQIRQFIQNERKKFIIYCVIAAVVLMAMIILVVVLCHRQKKHDLSDATLVNATQNETTLDEANQEELESVDQSKLEGEELNAEQMIQAAKQKASVFTPGIDVSRYQGKIDWQAVKASGITFAIIKVGHRTYDKGVIVEDPYASYNLWQAAEAGLQVGVYFATAAVSEDEAIEEANWTLDFISKYSITYPVTYDCEGFEYGGNRMSQVSKDERTSNAIAFVQTVQSQGYEGMVHSTMNSFSGSRDWDYDRLKANCKLWVAYYSGGDEITDHSPGADGSYDMWQYTQKGSVSGISSYVDLNVAYFGHDSTAAPKENGEIPKVNSAELGITFTTASDNVTAKEQTNLRDTPNMSGNIVATINNGDVVARTGIGDNGWSRLNYNGTTVYAKTQLLTTNLVPTTTSANVVVNGMEFFPITPVNVTAKSETNLRTVPSSESDSTIVTTLKKGDYVKCIARSKDPAWSRIEYNGKIVFAVTSYLTEE